MRVERTFAFADLCGFTAFTDARGDEEAVVVLTRFRAAVRSIASDFGVRVAKWLGDGAMFVARDGHALVAAILELEQHLRDAGLVLPLRAGLATGAVILFEGDDYSGQAVNLAARLADAAAPHEVLATPDVGELAPDWAVALQAGARVVKGFAAPIEVCRLVGGRSIAIAAR